MRLFRWTGFLFVAIVAVAIATLLVPLETWRTGELWRPRLTVVTGGPSVDIAERVWIDTDAACGYARDTDPDDCLALLMLAGGSNLYIEGISTVFGNASLEVTDRTTRSLASALADSGIEMPPVYRGSGQPDATAEDAPVPAHVAIRDALERGPLTFVAFGPLTNLAAALNGHPTLQANVTRLVAVMGRRPGHLFHPAEGEGGGILFGHGPVFRDFNFDKDRVAATTVLNMKIPTTLMPYDAARHVSITQDDLARLSEAGGAASDVAKRARGWLDFWSEDVGRNGFYPFDLLAAAYVIEQQLFDCAEAEAWIGRDDRLWNLWFYDPLALLVGRPGDAPLTARARAHVLYCTNVRPEFHSWLLERLRPRAH